jgi:Cys-tRNA(Pro) deacylase
MGVDEHQVIKTLIMENQSKAPLIVLMHGDQDVSTRALARSTGQRSIRPCDPAVAERHSGYQVGGTSPFGTRRPMPVYCQASILQLPHIYINGGKRGYIISLDPQDMGKVLDLIPVDIAR